LHRIQEQLSIHLIQHRIPKGIYLDYNGTEIIRDTIESDEFILEQNIYVPKKENIIDEKIEKLLQWCSDNNIPENDAKILLKNKLEIEHLELLDDVVFDKMKISILGQLSIKSALKRALDKNNDSKRKELNNENNQTDPHENEEIVLIKDPIRKEKKPKTDDNIYNVIGIVIIAILLFFFLKAFKIIN